MAENPATDSMDSTAELIYLPELPTFFPDQDPVRWFNALDITFEAFNVTDDKQRFVLAFNTIISQKDVPFLDLIDDIPEEKRYDWLRVEVCRRLGIMQLLKGKELGDRRSSEYLQDTDEKALDQMVHKAQVFSENPISVSIQQPSASASDGVSISIAPAKFSSKNGLRAEVQGMVADASGPQGEFNCQNIRQHFNSHDRKKIKF